MILRPFLNPDKQDRCERCGKPLVPGAAYLGEFSRPSRHRVLCGGVCAWLEEAYPLPDYIMSDTEYNRQLDWLHERSLKAAMELLSGPHTLRLPDLPKEPKP